MPAGPRSELILRGFTEAVELLKCCSGRDEHNIHGHNHRERPATLSLEQSLPCKIPPSSWTFLNGIFANEVKVGTGFCLFAFRVSSNRRLFHSRFARQAVRECESLREEFVRAFLIFEITAQKLRGVFEKFSDFFATIR